MCAAAVQDLPQLPPEEVKKLDAADALAHAVDLIHTLADATQVLQPLLTAPGATRLRSALDSFRTHAMAKAKAPPPQTHPATQRPVGSADEEKAAELLQRCAIGLKDLSQRLTAPGKKD